MGLCGPCRNEPLTCADNRQNTRLAFRFHAVGDAWTGAALELESFDSAELWRVPGAAPVLL